MTGRTGPLQTAALVLVVGSALLACKKKRAPPPPIAAPARSATATAAGAQGFTGSFTISEGKNPDGSPYSGTATISSHGDYDTLSWTISGAGGGNYVGVGIETGGVLAVGYGESKPGVVVYKVNGGSLTGKWAMSGASGLGTENLSGPAGVKGTYSITSSSSPQSGHAYHGKVAIKVRGAVRDVRWTLTSGESYSGVGILDGDLFIVGWGRGTGAVVYRDAAGKGLHGRFALPGVEGIGSETLARH